MIEWDRSVEVGLAEAAVTNPSPPETVNDRKILLGLAIIVGALVLTFALMPATPLVAGDRGGP